MIVNNFMNDHNLRVVLLFREHKPLWVEQIHRILTSPIMLEKVTPPKTILNHLLN